MDLGLRDATAVVVGGTRGMGLATAECLAEDGARVALMARSAKGLEEAAELVRKAGAPEALALVADVRELEQVDAAFAEVRRHWGELNILVNLVGPDASTGSVESLSDHDWDVAFDTGAIGAVRCVRAALPLLRKAEWARIVNVSAQSTKRQSPELIAYTASKSALTSISKNLARALAPDGILVNTVSPGTFLSEGLRGYLDRLPADRDVDPDNPRDAMRVIDEDFGHPADLYRAGLPSEIGAVIAFLASRRNSYMTGANLNVDGGSDFT